MVKRKPSRKKPSTTPLAENLKRILKERNISLRVAAQMAGVSVSTISDWMNGSTPADLQKVASLARGLAVSFSFLTLGYREDSKIDDLTIDDLYEAEGRPVEGLFKISAIRLVRRKR